MFIVNRAGGTHSVEDAHGAELIESDKARLATDEEVAAWYKAQGLKVPPAPKPSSDTAKQ